MYPIFIDNASDFLNFNVALDDEAISTLNASKKYFHSYYLGISNTTIMLDQTEIADENKIVDTIGTFVVPDDSWPYLIKIDLKAMTLKVIFLDILQKKKI